MDIKEKLRSLPHLPGVYLMKDSLDTIIYVGKSKNLKNRVSSYFQNSKNHSSKVIRLVNNIHSFDYIITDTEFDALVLECRLIKQLKPHYNSMLKKSDSYKYLKIDLSLKYPSMEITSEATIDEKFLFFGPYGKNNLENALDGVRNHLKILCDKKSRNVSTCLSYSLGLCLGMCCQKVSSEEYMKSLNLFINLLNGESLDLLSDMEKKMAALAAEFEFEAAARYRDYIKAVGYLVNKSKVIRYSELRQKVVLLEKLDEERFKVFFIRGNSILYSEIYTLKGLTTKVVVDKISEKAISSFSNSEDVISTLKKHELDEAQIIYSYLKSCPNGSRYVVIEDSMLAMPAAVAKIIDNLLSNKN